jgi:hypothetical protein
MLGVLDHRVSRVTRRYASLLARLDRLARTDGYGSAFAATTARSIRDGNEPTVMQLRVISAVCDRGLAGK